MRYTNESHKIRDVEEFAVRNEDFTIIVQSDFFARKEDLESVKADLRLQLVTHDRVIIIPSNLRCIVATKSGEKDGHKQTVIAWMPIPEPYKAESEEV